MISSCALFILMEVLSHLLQVEFESGRIGKFVHPKGCPIISYLLYVNDLLVFMNGECKYFKQLLKILGVYKIWSR